MSGVSRHVSRLLVCTPADLSGSPRRLVWRPLSPPCVAHMQCVRRQERRLACLYTLRVSSIARLMSRRSHLLSRHSPHHKPLPSPSRPPPSPPSHTSSPASPSPPSSLSCLFGSAPRRFCPGHGSHPPAPRRPRRGRGSQPSSLLPPPYTVHGGPAGAAGSPPPLHGGPAKAAGADPPSTFYGGLAGAVGTAFHFPTFLRSPAGGCGGPPRSRSLAGAVAHPPPLHGGPAGAVGANPRLLRGGLAQAAGASPPVPRRPCWGRWG